MQFMESKVAHPHIQYSIACFAPIMCRGCVNLGPLGYTVANSSGDHRVGLEKMRELRVANPIPS